MTSLRVLVAGVPRSGSSWVGRVLGGTPGAGYLNEPDNHEHSPFALRAKLGLPGRFYPDLEPGDDAPAYSTLWTNAFGEGRTRDSLPDRLRRKVSERLLHHAGAEEVRRAFEADRRLTPGLRAVSALAVPERPRESDRLVVKSVHAPLALEWIASRFRVDVVVVLRNPLNVLSSWKEMGWLRPGSDTLSELDLATARRLELRYGVDTVGATTVEQAAHLIALLHSALRDAARRHPDWVVLSHEALCDQPQEGFKEAAETLGLRWGGSVEELLDDLNRPGKGYQTARVASDLAEVWRSRLAPEEQDAARAVFSRFAGLEAA